MNVLLRDSRIALLVFCGSILLAATRVGAQSVSQVMFSYQGRVKVQGVAYNGTGQFKLSMLDSAANVTLWSNDGTTGTAGIQPTASISLVVTDGVFNVMVGDTSVPGMSVPINPTIFQSKTPLKLRVWFSDGTHGFQQLTPDQNLVNLAIIAGQTGTQDFSLYVNGTTGDDLNNGLTTSTAKRTIQSAADVLPPIVRCNVTVRIAPGIYHEFVDLTGLSASSSKSIMFLGDSNWTPASPSDPTVRITGLDAANTTSVRDLVLRAQQCSGIELRGIYFDHGRAGGVWLANGIYTVTNCKAAYNHQIGTGDLLWIPSGGGFGFLCTQQGFADMSGIVSSYNDTVGIYAIRGGMVKGTEIHCDHNTAHGVFANTFASIRLAGNGTLTFNTQIGAAATFHAITEIGTGFVVSNNGTGASATYQSFIAGGGVNLSNNTFPSYTSGGGAIY